MIPFHQAEMDHFLGSNNAKQTQRKQYYHNRNISIFVVLNNISSLVARVIEL